MLELGRGVSGPPALGSVAWAGQGWEGMALGRDGTGGVADGGDICRNSVSFATIRNDRVCGLMGEGPIGPASVGCYCATDRSDG